MMTEEPSEGEASEPRGELAVRRVDRDRAVQLSGRSAGQLLGQLETAARTGRGLRRAVNVGDVFELVPPEELIKGLGNGTLRTAKSKAGDASVLIKHVKDGKIAGHARLQKLPKPSPLKAFGGMGLAAITCAVEQKQLAEISEQLKRLDTGIEEVKKLHYDDRAGTARTAKQLAEQVRVTNARKGRVPDNLLEELRHWRTETQAVLNRALATAEGHVDQYADGKLVGADADRALTQSFTGLIVALDAFAEANATLTGVNYAEARQHQDALDDATHRMQTAERDVHGLAQRVMQANWMRETDEEDFEARRQKSAYARNIPTILQWTLLEDDPNGLLLRKWPKGPPPLKDQTAQFLRGIVTSDHPNSSELIVEVIDEGVVLIGPPANADGPGVS